MCVRDLSLLCLERAPLRWCVSGGLHGKRGPVGSPARGRGALALAGLTPRCGTRLLRNPSRISWSELGQWPTALCFYRSSSCAPLPRQVLPGHPGLWMAGPPLRSPLCKCRFTPLGAHGLASAVCSVCVLEYLFTSLTSRPEGDKPGWGSGLWSTALVRPPWCFFLRCWRTPGSWQMRGAQFAVE